MAFYPNKRIDLDKLPQSLATELTNYYLKTVSQNDLNDSVNGLDPRDHYANDVNTLLALTDDNPAFFLGKHAHELDLKLKQEIEGHLFLYLKDAPQSLQDRVKPYLESSEPTAELYLLVHEDPDSEVIKLKAEELNSYLEPEYTTRNGVRPRFELEGNIVWEYDRFNGNKYISKIFDTCADAEIFIMEYIEDTSLGRLYFEFSKGLIEDVINNVFEYEESPDGELNKEKQQLLDELEKL